MADGDMRGEFEYAYDGDLIGEIWRLRVEVANSVPRSRYEAADREHKEEMQARCAAYHKKLEDLREWCSKRANASFMIHGEWPAARAFEETARHIGDVLFEAERGETEVA